MKKQGFAALACLLLTVADAGAQGGDGGGGGGGRQRAGGAARCGSELVVVLPDGKKREYTPTAAFLESFKTLQIEQGESPRDAVPVDEVLKAHGADWMEALDCNNRSVHLPSGLPFEGRDYLVLTGKRGLKAVREVRRGAFTNSLADIRKLTLHKVSPPQATPPGK